MNFFTQTNFATVIYILFLSIILFGTGNFDRTQNVHQVKLLTKEIMVLDQTDEIILEFKIDEGKYIHSIQPIQEWCIPTSLTLNGVEGIQIGQVQFPETFQKQLSEDQGSLEVYHGNVSFRLPVKVNAILNKESYKLSGNLYYQACSDVKCYFPRMLEFEVQLFTNSIP